MPITDAPSLGAPTTALPQGLAVTSDTPGLTNSVPVNLGVGGGILGGGNGAMSATAGWETAAIGGVIALILAGLWEIPWFKQQPVILKYSLSALVGVTAGFAIFSLIGHAPGDLGIAKGCTMVLEGLADEFGIKISGIGSFLPKAQ